VATAPASPANRVLTIPNVISFVRLAMIPVFLWLLFGRDNPFGAAALLAVVGATDWVDGYVARHFNQVSTLGKVLDPIADRLVFIVCVGGIIVYGGAPVWFSVLVVVRELVVGATVAVLTLRGMPRVDVQWAGKAGTFGLLCAFPWFLAGSADVAGAELFTLFGWLCGIPGLVLSYYAAVTYVPILRRAYAEGRRSRG
jgi:cardiolipin synthase